MRGIVSMLLSVAACAPCAARLDTAVLAASKDNTLYEDSEGALSNGAGDYFFAGLTLRDILLRRGVIAFDVASAIPPGSVIEHVELQLFMSRTSGIAADVSLHRSMADWGEGDSDAEGEEGGGAPSAPGDATWKHTFFPGSFWSADGGDFAPAPSATTLVDDFALYSWSTDAMAGDVQAWLDSPTENFGWFVIGDEASNGNTKRFDSRDNELGTPPRLVVTFTPPACADCDADTICDEEENDCDANGVPDQCQEGFCPADLAPPIGVLNIFDFLAFQSAFGSEGACADLSAPFGVLNVFDFLAFLSSFGNGC